MEKRRSTVSNVDNFTESTTGQSILKMCKVLYKERRCYLNLLCYSIVHLSLCFNYILLYSVYDLHLYFIYHTVKRHSLCILFNYWVIGLMHNAFNMCIPGGRRVVRHYALICPQCLHTCVRQATLLIPTALTSKFLCIKLYRDRCYQSMANQPL